MTTDIFKIIEEHDDAYPSDEFQIKITAKRNKFHLYVPDFLSGQHFMVNSETNEEWLVLTLIDEKTKSSRMFSAQTHDTNKAFVTSLVCDVAKGLASSLATKTMAHIQDGKMYIKLPEFRTIPKVISKERFAEVANEFYQLLDELNLKPVLRDGEICFVYKGYKYDQDTITQ